ncbi:spliceosomal snRNP component [Maudiozyma exigua]|uniref:Spliceosomal snRNP component n=1 Tax=Maudiozyma exigua TaxID=34358 RepID=A0A9P6W1Z2_MAUEX|nr:spliceosomal snRNP component [Kazachstania exigua]
MGENNTSGFVDPVFGQSPAFGLNDDAVNPLAIKYLKNVRREALALNITNYRPEQNNREIQYSASIYDDDDGENTLSNNIPQDSSKNTHAIELPGRLNNIGIDDLIIAPFSSSDDIVGDEKHSNSELALRLTIFNKSMDIWLKWFQDTRSKILNEAFTTQEYDDDTLDLLIYYLKEYLKKSKAGNRGIEGHLQNLLKDYYIDDEILSQNEWTIDEEWVAPALSRLRSIRIHDINDIKMCLKGNFSNKKPRNYEQWTKFIRENEPNSSIFATMLKQDDIWIILKFMKQNWLKVLMKKPEQSSRTSMWLLYSLFYLSENLNSTQLSTLRDFAKRCQGLYLEKFASRYSDDPQQQAYFKQISVKLPSEMKVIGIKYPLEHVTILELVLVVVSQVFGQKDLIIW